MNPVFAIVGVVLAAIAAVYTIYQHRREQLGS